MLHQIGVGALGPVFRTYEPTRDRLVAVKVFRLDLTPEQSSALADELARATQVGLFHPSIVEPLAAGLEGTVAYRAEEYVAAESLDVAMRHYAPATMDKALPFITQLAAAIDFARAAGVGHGALHPRDIFVTPDEARASGFGVVDALERLGLRAPVRRPYSSPERIAGKPWTTAADVFSLGAIAFELLTGRRPSGLGEQMGVLSGASLGSHEAEIRAVLARAMAEDPEARYSSAGEFAAALAEVAALTTAAVAAGAAETREPAGATIAADAGAGQMQQAEAAEALDVAQQEEDKEPKETKHERDEKREEAADGFATLDDFAPESTAPSPGDSPREVARKAIAARKRQHKAKPPHAAPGLDLVAAAPIAGGEAAADESPSARDTSTSDDRSPEATAAHEAAPVPATDVADAAAAIADSAAMNDIVAPAAAVEAGEEPVSAASLEAEPVPPAEPVKDFAPVESLPREGTSLSAMKLDEVSLNADAPEAAASGEMDRGITDLRPGEIEPELATEFNFRELVTESLKAEPPSSDRVITVDEFRAREIANARQDRTRQRGLRDRGLPPRVVPPPVPDLTEHDAGASSVPDEERARERFAMFPLAIGLIIGLLIGYGGGYFVGNREREAPSVVQNAPASELATPGTSGQTPSKTDTEQRVNPKSGGAPPVPSDTLAGRPSATSGARAAGKPPAPAATNKPTAAAKPTAKPSAPKAVTPPSAPRSGQMIITSTPSRAGVTIDGKWSGRTPLTLDNRRFGSYKIRVVQKGYEVASTTLTISAADPKARFDPALQATPAKTEKPAPPPSAAPKPAAPATSTPQAKPSASAAAAPKPTAKTGEIFVDSRPQGATVLVDGKPVGVTPLRLTGQPAGSHTVRLELADHQPWTSTTTVIGGQTARVTGSMERIR